MSGWYGRGERAVEIISGTALGNSPGRRVPIRYVLVRDPTGELEPQVFLCTDLEADPLDILHWFVRRWSIEVTFAEVRRHIGVETQRQWSDPAIDRTRPVLLGVFSVIMLWADQLYADQRPPQYVQPASCARFTLQVPEGMIVIPVTTFAAIPLPLPPH